MKSIAKAVLLAGIATTILAPAGSTQEHPKKAIFQDVPSWPMTSPGDVKLKNFVPYRAVYDRTYRQGAGPNAGDLRHDRVIITAEEGGWDGDRAAVVTIIDSGIAEHSDTNARVTAMFVRLDDLSVRFEIGPIPGKGKDYYVGRVTPNSVLMSMITTDTQGLQTRSLETDQPGFGPGSWVMASMKLKEGLKINTGPWLSPQANALTSTTFGHVVGQQSVVDGSGKGHKAWVVETSRNPTSPKVSHVYLVDKPPYYLGTETVNLNTEERKKFVWLRSFQKLEN